MYANKTIWITGASSGIGEAFAVAYAKKGAIIILSARNVEKLKLLKQQLGNGDRIIIAPIDLANHEDLSTKAKEIISKHKIDLLINNAGISQRSLVKNTDLKVFKKLMNVNYIGTVLLSKLVLSCRWKIWCSFKKWIFCL